jgi:hypothetical protein
MPDDVLIFVPAAIKAIMGNLAPRIEAAAGSPIVQIIDLNPAIPERIVAGQAYDVALTNPGYVTALIESGLADDASHHPFGRIPLAIGRKAGGKMSFVSGSVGVAEILKAAESIAYTGAGTSGRTFLETVEKLGLTDAVTSKSRAMFGGVPAASVAAAETEIAIAPLTTILATPGVVAAAIFPEELDAHIDISVFLGPGPRESAVRCLGFLTSSELDAELAAAGISRFELA